MNIHWTTINGKYGTHYNCYVGGIRVGSYTWNSLRSKSEEGNFYRFEITLPDIGMGTNTCDTQEQAKARVETIVKKWFEKALSK